MTAQTDPFTAVAQRSIEATTTAVRAWTESLQSYAGALSADRPLPRAAEVHTAVDAWFDLAAQLLTEQRTLANAAVDAAVEATGTFAEQARKGAAAATYRPGGASTN
jgi:hypothetical protein